MTSLPRTTRSHDDNSYGEARPTAMPLRDIATATEGVDVIREHIQRSAYPPSTIVPREPLVLTVAEAATLLGVSRAFAYELVARGQLPVLRLGRRIVIPKAALFQMVDAARWVG
jgi:excisionase family DNA binding protein